MHQGYSHLPSNRKKYLAIDITIELVLIPRIELCYLLFLLSDRLLCQIGTDDDGSTETPFLTATTTKDGLCSSVKLFANDSDGDD